MIVWLTKLEKFLGGGYYPLTHALYATTLNFKFNSSEYISEALGTLIINF